MKKYLIKISLISTLFLVICNLFSFYALAETAVTTNSTTKGYFILNKELITRGAVLSPVFSHSGRHISYIKKDEKGFYNLYVTFLDTKETAKVTNGLINWDDTWKLIMRANPWSKNDEYLIFPSKNKSVAQKFGEKEASIQLGITSFNGQEKVLVSSKDSYSYYPSWLYKSNKLVFITSPKNIQETDFAQICMYEMPTKDIKVLLNLDCTDYIPTGIYPSFDDEKLAVWFIERGSKNSILKIYNMSDMTEIASVQGEGRKMAYLPVYWTKDNLKLVFSSFVKEETDSYLSVYNLNTKKLQTTQISVVYPFPISDTKFFAHAPLYDLNTLNIEVDMVLLDLVNNIRIPIGKNIMVSSYDLNSIDQGIVKIVFWDRFKKPNEIVLASLEEKEIPQELLKEIKNNEEKDKIAKKLFESKVKIYELISILQEYFDKEKKYPLKLESLIKVGLLKGLPKDIFGQEIKYESSGTKYAISTYPYQGWSIFYDSNKGKFETKFVGTSPE